MTSNPVFNPDNNSITNIPETISNDTLFKQRVNFTIRWISAYNKLVNAVSGNSSQDAGLLLAYYTSKGIKDITDQINALYKSVSVGDIHTRFQDYVVVALGDIGRQYPIMSSAINSYITHNSLKSSTPTSIPAEDVPLVSSSDGYNWLNSLLGLQVSTHNDDVVVISETAIPRSSVPISSRITLPPNKYTDIFDTVYPTPNRHGNTLYAMPFIA